MGDVIYLAERRSRTQPRPAVLGERPIFFFDLGCPFSYLAAERVERSLGDVEWVPAAGSELRSASPLADDWRVAAERRALAMRLPMIWPDHMPVDATAAHRVAALAHELEVGARYALAASRLVFCGGFDLADPETIAEAAAAAGIKPRISLAAAQDARWDERIDARAAELVALGVRKLPAIHLRGRWFAGERRVADAAALLRAPVAADGPLAG